jgi:uncharacterized protein YyaL (SSP411 family)
MDNATPSGNSLALELLLRTAAVFGVDEYRTIALRGLAREMDVAARFPSGFGRFLSTLSRALSAPVEVVLLGDVGGGAMEELLHTAHRWYLPPRIVVGGDPASLPPLPILEGREARGESPTAYVCRDFTCSAPIQEPEALARELQDATQKVSG